MAKLIQFNNGLRLELVSKPKNMVQAAFRVAFLAGSEDEEIEQGVAHLLEHCTFKGTKEYSQEQLAVEMDKISAIPNASTSAEFTIYEAKFPKFNFQRLVELFSKMIFESKYDEQGIESEKFVVLEEIKMHDDVPADCAFDKLTNIMYKGTTLGFDIAGDAKLLKNVKREDLINFRDRHYIPENTIVSVVGDFEEEMVVALIDRYFVQRFNTIKNIEKKPKKWNERVSLKPETIIQNKKLNQANVMLGAYTTGYDDPDRIKLAIIFFVLGGSMSSRLFVKLRNQLSLCYSIYADQLNYKNNGFLLIDFSTSPINHERAIDEVKNVIEDIRKNGITEEEFILAKNVLLNNFLMSQDVPQSHISYLAYNGKLFNPQAREKEIRALNKKDCEEAFRKYIDGEKFFVSVVK